MAAVVTRGGTDAAAHGSAAECGRDNLVLPCHRSAAADHEDHCHAKSHPSKLLHLHPPHQKDCAPLFQKWFDLSNIFF
jgi:hypothetical protein